MRVLIACEFSGIVREAFNQRGHDAWSCDFLPTEIPGQHLQCDVLDVLDAGWDLMIAHPPCTYLARSGMRWNAEDLTRKYKTEEAVDFVLELLEANIPRIALENPIGVLSSYVRKPDQIIQPYEFGEDVSKKTCFWLKGLPPLKPTKYIAPRLVCCGLDLPNEVGKYGCPNCHGFETPVQRWSNQSPSGGTRETNSKSRWKERSRTLRGIADAMAEQWGIE